jgi:hypothetical protein
MIVLYEFNLKTSFYSELLNIKTKISIFCCRFPAHVKIGATFGLLTAYYLLSVFIVSFPLKAFGSIIFLAFRNAWLHICKI